MIDIEVLYILLPKSNFLSKEVVQSINSYLYISPEWRYFIFTELYRKYFFKIFRKLPEDNYDKFLKEAPTAEMCFLVERSITLYKSIYESDCTCICRLIYYAEIWDDYRTFNNGFLKTFRGNEIFACPNVRKMYPYLPLLINKANILEISCKIVIKRQTETFLEESLQYYPITSSVTLYEFMLNRARKQNVKIYKELKKNGFPPRPWIRPKRIICGRYAPVKNPLSWFYRHWAYFPAFVNYNPKKKEKKIYPPRNEKIMQKVSRKR